METIKNLPFSPAATGTLLYALTRAPEQYRTSLLDKICQYLSERSISRSITALKWLFAYGVLRNVHVFLSEIAQNNFSIRSQRHRYVWDKEIAVVTGAASGFGALMAKGLAAKGVNVMAIDIRDDMPEDMKANPKIHYYKCNVTDRQAVMELGKRIEKEHGEVSILINNAGVCYQHTILDATEKALNNLHGVNIMAHYWTLQAFLPNMVKNKKGHVVAIASMASFVSPPGMIPYCNSKAAVLSLHEGLKQEMRAIYNAPEIKFTSVHPTFAATNMTQPFMDEMTKSGAFILRPEDVADAAVNQVLSGKGRQIVLAGGLGWISGMRGWPFYISQALLQLSEKKGDMPKPGAERAGG